MKSATIRTPAPARSSGAVLGGVAGGAIEEGRLRAERLQITVKLDGGRTIAIAQEAGEEFKVGERVRIVTGDGVSRVC